MKKLLALCVLSPVLSAVAADPQPFAVAPLQLSVLPLVNERLLPDPLPDPFAAKPATDGISPGVLQRRLFPLPLGPVRVDYGTMVPAPAADAKARSPFLDAPGPGYRQHSEMPVGK